MTEAVDGGATGRGGGLRRLSLNAFASSASTVVNAVLLFALYHFLVRRLGIESIGVWSLVLATASVARLGEYGMAGGVARFVAGDLGAGRPERAAATVGMAIAFLALAVGLCALALWPLASWVLERTIDDAALLGIARELLPWTLAASWLAAIVNLLCATLDGNQRTGLRALAMMTGGTAQLVLAWILVPRLGLAALGPVQLAFLAVQALLLALALLRVMRQPAAAWLRGSMPRFREMLAYGSGLQLTAIGQLLFEPTVRWLLGAFAGLAVTGYYEMASRAVVQLRLAITAAFQMLVPFYASRLGASRPGASQLGQERAGGEDREETRRVYRRTFRLLLLVCTPYFVLIGCALPYALTLWGGTFSTTFVAIGLICLAGWSVNLLAVPAFMLYLALGRVRWVAVQQLVIGVLNVVLGLALGAAFGGIGVALGAMLALSLGSLVVVVRFERGVRSGSGRLRAAGVAGAARHRRARRRRVRLARVRLAGTHAAAVAGGRGARRRRRAARRDRLARSAAPRADDPSRGAGVGRAQVDTSGGMSRSCGNPCRSA